MNRTTRYIAVAAAAFCVLLGCPTAQAAVITSAAIGDFDQGPTWTGGLVPVLNDTASLTHKVTMDKDDSGSGGADETTLADIQVNSGGYLDAWYGRITAGDLTFNGGTVKAAQRTLVLNVDSVTVNDVAGNVWGTTKNQKQKHAELHTPTMTGTGTLTAEIGHLDQLYQFDVTDATGFTGTLDVTRMAGREKSTKVADLGINYAHLKINNSITEANASFDLVLTSAIYDWLEEDGGTAALDDGTAYNGYDIRDAGTTVWVTSLTIGGFSVTARAGTPYTYTELAAMNGGDVANYLRTDGTDGTLGVIPEPATMALLALGACALVVRRKRRRA